MSFNKNRPEDVGRARAMQSQGVPVTVIARVLGVTKATAEGYLRSTPPTPRRARTSHTPYAPHTCPADPARHPAHIRIAVRVFALLGASAESTTATLKLSRAAYKAMLAGTPPTHTPPTNSMDDFKSMAAVRRSGKRTPPYADPSSTFYLPTEFRRLALGRVVMTATTSGTPLHIALDTLAPYGTPEELATLLPSPPKIAG